MGVATFNDISATGAIRALRLAGHSVPKDVSVVGIDDVSIAALHHPALTTVRQPLHRMGMLAAQVALDRLQNPGRQPSAGASVLVEPELIVRESTEPALRGIERSRSSLAEYDHGPAVRIHVGQASYFAD